jgi:GR25 family glycosyltransferase involved in LPS biosynthesis
MPKNFVISLESTPQRLRAFKSNNPGLEFEWFKAINGKRLEREALIESGLLSESCGYTDSQVGCALSHVSVWDKCIKEQVSITIFEDDAIVHPKFSEFAEFYSTTNDYIFWGWNFDAPLSLEISEGLGPINIITDQVFMRENYQKHLSSEIKIQLHNLTFLCGVMAYTLSPRIAQILLKNNLPIRERECQMPLVGKIKNSGIDLSMSIDLKDLGAVVCLPPLALSLNDKAHSTVNPI